MKRFAILLSVAIGALTTNAAAGDDLLGRMAALNPNLHSYSATMHAHVALTTFPFLSTDIVATYYHKDPDLDKLDITSGLPMVAQGFSKLYPHIEPPARWDEVYVVTKGSDDGTVTKYRLVPRKQGNVEQIEVTADDVTATVRSMRWDYANGGWATMNNRYANVGGNTVVTAQTGHVEEPNYKGDITTTLSGYQLNPALPDSIFTE
jgi:outer membrane lipoprotein-sorting protein